MNKEQVKATTINISASNKTGANVNEAKAIFLNVLKSMFFLIPNAASNCRSELAAFLRLSAKKKTVYGGQIDWLCYVFALDIAPLLKFILCTSPLKSVTVAMSPCNSSASVNMSGPDELHIFSPVWV